MSHTATVDVEIKDPKAFQEACKKLGIECNLDEEVTLFDRSTHRGMTARLPGWRYPVVFKDGKAYIDTYNERWGKLSELEKLQQTYSTEAAKRKIPSKFRVTETVQSNGTIRLTCTEKGAY